MSCLTLNLRMNDLPSGVHFLTQAFGKPPSELPHGRAEWTFQAPCLHVTASSERGPAPPSPMLWEL